MKFKATYPTDDEREYMEFFDAASVAEAHVKAKELLPKDTFVDRYHLEIKSPPSETVYLDDKERFQHAVVTVHCKELDKTHDFTAQGYGMNSVRQKAIDQAKNVWSDDMTFEITNISSENFQVD